MTNKELEKLNKQFNHLTAALEALKPIFLSTANIHAYNPTISKQYHEVFLPIAQEYQLVKMDRTLAAIINEILIFSGNCPQVKTILDTIAAHQNQIEPETKINVSNLLIATWIVANDELKSEHAKNLIINTLRANLLDGGGCWAGISGRLVYPFSHCVRWVLEDKLSVQYNGTPASSTDEAVVSLVEQTSLQLYKEDQKLKQREENDVNKVLQLSFQEQEQINQILALSLEEQNQEQEQEQEQINQILALSLEEQNQEQAQEQEQINQILALSLEEQNQEQAQEQEQEQINQILALSLEEQNQISKNNYPLYPLLFQYSNNNSSFLEEEKTLVPDKSLKPSLLLSPNNDAENFLSEDEKLKIAESESLEVYTTEEEERQLEEALVLSLLDQANTRLML